MVAAETLFILVVRQRTVEQKSLCHTAVDATQEFRLFLGLHALGNHFHIQIVHHVYDVLDYDHIVFPVLFLFFHVVEEGFIQLDRRRGAVIAIDADKAKAYAEVKRALRIALAKGSLKNVSREEVHEMVDELFDEYGGKE